MDNSGCSRAGAGVLIPDSLLYTFRGPESEDSSPAAEPEQLRPIDQQHAAAEQRHS